MAASLGLASAAGAQTAPSLEADNGVLSRARPGLDAEGLPLGGFRVYPRLDASIGYSDNVYATQYNKFDSAIVTLEPSVSLQSNWNRHAFNLSAMGTIERYTSLHTEDNDRYKINGTGRIDMGSSSHVDLEAHSLQTIESRGTPGDTFTRGDPTMYHDNGASGGLTTSLGRLQLNAGGQFSRVTYDSVRIDDVDVSQKYRNRDYYAATVGAAYGISPALQPFVSVTYDHTRYDQRALLTSFDSHGTTVLGGLNISLTKLVTGRIGFGYRWRDYRNPNFRSSNGLTYDIAVVWNPRTLMAVTLEAIKAVDESPSAQSSGIVRNQGSVTVDYELLRNIILQVSGTAVGEKFRDTDNSDNRFVASFGARYLMNRFAEIGLHYDHTHQNGTSLFRGPYTDNNLRLTLTLQR